MSIRLPQEALDDPSAEAAPIPGDRSGAQDQIPFAPLRAVGPGHTPATDAAADVASGPAPDMAIDPVTGAATGMVSDDPATDHVSGVETALQAVEHLAISRTPEVLATDAWAEAGRKVLRFHLSRMLAKVPGTIAGEDPEELHAMRVAARRVRAAWRVFGDGYDRPVVREHVRQLRTLGGRLGAVRDLDVQGSDTGRPRSGRGYSPES